MMDCLARRRSDRSRQDSALTDTGPPGNGMKISNISAATTIQNISRDQAKIGYVLASLR